MSQPSHDSDLLAQINAGIKKAILAELPRPIAHVVIHGNRTVRCNLLSVEELVALLFDEYYGGRELEEDGKHAQAELEWVATIAHIRNLIVQDWTTLDDTGGTDVFLALRPDELNAWYTEHYGRPRRGAS